MLSCIWPPEDHSHTPDDQPIELEAPVAGGEAGKTNLRAENKFLERIFVCTEWMPWF